MTRQTLRATELTGPRRTIRNIGFFALAILGAVAAIGYLLPAHRLDGEMFHSNAADGGPLPLVAHAVVIAAGLTLRRLRLGAGVITGLLAGGAAFASAVAILLRHLFQSPEIAYGEHMFAVGVLGLFFVGVAFVIAEPILYVLERRRNEIAARPAPLPVAIATRA